MGVFCKHISLPFLFLHLSNDQGNIFLLLIILHLLLSLSNDCSYLISPYPAPPLMLFLPLPARSESRNYGSRLLPQFLLFTCAIIPHSCVPFFSSLIHKSRVVLLQLCSFDDVMYLCQTDVWLYWDNIFTLFCSSSVQLTVVKRAMTNCLLSLLSLSALLQVSDGKYFFSPFWIKYIYLITFS